MAPSGSQPGVHARLTDLVRLRHAARGIHFLPRQPGSSVLAGQRASRLRGRGLDFEELRGYRPGDDVRSIDWRATARLRKAQVRVYTEERDRPGLLVVDQRKGMFFGSRKRMKSVVAAEAAALVAWRLLAQGDRVGAVVFGDEELSYIRPDRSTTTVLRILKEILRFNHALGVEREAPENPAMLGEALERAARVATHDHFVCLVTDANGRGPEVDRSLKRLAVHNDLLTMVVSDPIGRLLPRAGRLDFTKEGRRLQVDSSAGGVQERFAERYDALAGDMRGFFRRLDVPLLSLTTDGDVLRQMRRQLGAAPGGPA